MKYAYYPGCSLLESATEYDVSVRRVMETLGAELTEIPDWTCCGASAAEHVSRLMAYALPARNLALSAQELPGQDVLVPCSACYLNLLRVEREVQPDRKLSEQVAQVLAASGLTYSGLHGSEEVKVRHFLDVLMNDVGEERLAKRVLNPLEGMKVAPYYGCQILRPYPVFDDPARPVSMDGLLRTMGGEVFEWDMANRCCGASLMATHPTEAMVSVTAILSAAEGADAIVTVCPLCQMNLDAYQGRARRMGGAKIPVLYLSQLMGIAMGLGENAVQLKKNLSLPPAARERIWEKAWKTGGRADLPAAEEAGNRREPNSQGG